jgi:zinc transport system substrate-binding protein
MSQHQVKTFLLGMLLVLSSIASLSCGGREQNNASGNKPRVAVSIFPLYDIARRVAGDRLDVVLVLPPGRSEHNYDPTPSEMARIAQAQLAISVGLGMDEWLERLVRGAAGSNVPIVQLGPNINPRQMTAEEIGAEAIHGEGHDDHDHHEHGRNAGDAHEHERGAPDPHFWLDPIRMSSATDAIVEAFSRLDPSGSDNFRARGTEVKRSLEALHQEIEAKSRGWTRKTIVTFHGSMGYFADRYGLEIASVIEPFPGREPTPRYLQAVLRAIERRRPAALFSEPQLERRPAETIAAQSRLPLYELDPIGGGSGVESYEQLLRHNATVLDGALR